jgi:hypothetical protein
MQEPAEQDDATAHRTDADDAGSRPGGLVDYETLARRQAALVRESLVRCPDAGGPAAQ